MWRCWIYAAADPAVAVPGVRRHNGHVGSGWRDPKSVIAGQDRYGGFRKAGKCWIRLQIIIRQKAAVVVCFEPGVQMDLIEVGCDHLLA